jgi:fatty acid desaturase
MSEDPLKHAQAEFLRAQTREIEERNREKRASATRNTIITLVIGGIGLCFAVACIVILIAASNTPGR